MLHLHALALQLVMASRAMWEPLQRNTELFAVFGPFWILVMFVNPSLSSPNTYGVHFKEAAGMPPSQVQLRARSE